MFPSVQQWQMCPPQPILIPNCETQNSRRLPLRDISVHQELGKPEIVIQRHFQPKMDDQVRSSCALRGKQPTGACTDNDVTVDVFTALHYDQTMKPTAGCHDSVPLRYPCAYENNNNRSQLRLPAIRATPNVAANVMSEECDLGYSSFTDLSALPDISDSINCSNDSDDAMFSDGSPSFADIIDDVLDTIENIVPETTENRPSVVDFVPSAEQIEKAPVTYSTSPKNINYQNFVINPVYMDSHQDIVTPAYFVVPNSQLPVKADEIYFPYCHICNRSFQSKNSLRLHMRSHVGNRPHLCPYCDKTFAQKSTLRTHIRTHTGEKPYACQFCSRAFGDYSTFRKHVRVHTGEKPYVCDVCKKGFTQSGNMLRHREVHFKKSSGECV